MAKPPPHHPILPNDNRHHDFPSHPVRHGEEENNRERQSQSYSLAHLTTNPRTLLCLPSTGKLLPHKANRGLAVSLDSTSRRKCSGES